MQMDTLASNEDKDLQSSREWLTELALRQLQVLEEATDAIDRKAGILLGFIAVGIPLALQLGITQDPNALDFLFTYASFGTLFASLVILVVCLGPRERRLDPNAQKLLDSLWSREGAAIRENVAATVKEAWEFNCKAHARKASLFTWALWLTVSGVGLLAFEMLVIRVVC